MAADEGTGSYLDIACVLCLVEIVYSITDVSLTYQVDEEVASKSQRRFDVTIFLFL